VPPFPPSPLCARRDPAGRGEPGHY
jgi:hypothetical protein